MLALWTLTAPGPSRSGRSPADDHTRPVPELDQRPGWVGETDTQLFDRTGLTSLLGCCLLSGDSLSPSGRL